MNANSEFESHILHILPTGLRVEQELADRLPEAQGVLLGHRVVTFPQLIDAIFKELHPRPRPLSPLGQHLILKNTVRLHCQSKGKMRYFKGLARFGLSGFVTTLMNFFWELKQALIWPEEFDRLIHVLRVPEARVLEAKELPVEQLPNSDSGKYQELAALYSDYAKELKQRNLIDDFDKQKLVLELLRDKASDKTRSISFLRETTELRMDDIYNPSLLQFEIVLALAERLENARVTIPYNPDRQDAFKFLEETVRMFERLGESTHKFDPADIFTAIPEEGRGLISHIMANIFKSPEELANVKKLPPDGSIRITSAQGLYREVEAIAREVRKLLDRGIKTNQIGVVFRNLGDYGQIVEEVFRRFQLPLYFRRGNPLLSSPLIKTILSIMELIRSNFERDMVLKFLFSDYIRFPILYQGEALTAREVELIALQSGMLNENSVSWLDCLKAYEKRLRRQMESEPGQERNTRLKSQIGKTVSLRKGLENFLRLLKDFEKPKPFLSFLAALKGLLKEFKVQKCVRRAGEAEILRRDLAAMKSFKDVLEDVETTLKMLGEGEKKVHLEDFYGLLREGLSAASIPGPAANRSGIKVLQVHDAIGLRFDYLFLGGLTDGQFPERKYENPIFTDSDKKAFNQVAQKAIFRNLTIRHQEEPLLFYLALATVRKKLYLSYSTLDAKGTLALPSTFLKGLIRLIDVPSTRAESRTEEEKEKYDSLFQEVGFYAVPELNETCAEGELIESLSLALHGHGDSVSSPAPISNRDRISNSDLYLTAASLILTDKAYEPLGGKLRQVLKNVAIEAKRETFYLCEKPEARLQKATPWTGRIEDKELLSEINARYLTGKPWSPTQLEEYGRCPFSFFLSRILGIAELERPDVEPERTREGSMVHEILYHFFAERHREDGKLPLTEVKEELDRLKEVENRVFKDYQTKYHLGDDRFWQIRKQGIRTRLARFITYAFRKEKLFSPAHFEFTFEEEAESGHGPLVIKDKQGREVRLTGKIDRIDTGIGGYRVVDYKDSKKDYNDSLKKENLCKTSFQIPTYLLAAEELMKKEPLERQAGFYFLKNTDPKKNEKFKSFTTEDLEQFQELIITTVENARQGRFDVSPYKNECSTFCQFRNVCRFVPVRQVGEE
ncbi:exodeoxyribonuclease V subunit gamma [candidate division NPL-UPA2 bacterium]|nr:exodeoxyribonuclease V subunit gamma [candidate division NPL-UPA2 bacterium]